MSRKIKFLPDTGNPTVIEAEDNLTLGGFVELLVAKGVDFNLEKNLLTELDSKAIYATPEAVLPNGDIRLFSTVKDPKGNTRSRKEIYADVNSFITRDGDRAKNFFNKDQNFTRVGSDILEKRIEAYGKKYGAGKTSTSPVKASGKTPATKAPAKAKSTPVAKKVSTSEEEENIRMKAAQKTFHPTLHRRR